MPKKPVHAQPAGFDNGVRVRLVLARRHPGRLPCACGVRPRSVATARDTYGQKVAHAHGRLILVHPRSQPQARRWDAGLLQPLAQRAAHHLLPRLTAALGEALLAVGLLDHANVDAAVRASGSSKRYDASPPRGLPSEPAGATEDRWLLWPPVPCGSRLEQGFSCGCTAGAVAGRRGNVLRQDDVFSFAALLCGSAPRGHRNDALRGWSQENRGRGPFALHLCEAADVRRYSPSPWRPAGTPLGRAGHLLGVLNHTRIWDKLCRTVQRTRGIVAQGSNRHPNHGDGGINA
mmetsp:Transcript_8919/g.26200  ORF Transcript_8919/g.26200 Transcript_8919/m.26200 type:complete len:290 (+) Transcript_8919:358-1227(+)